MNFLFNKYIFLAAGFCPKNLAFARKIMALPESGGLHPPVPLTRTPMEHVVSSVHINYNENYTSTELTHKITTMQCNAIN